MKYFTPEWWTSAGESANNASELYYAYWKSIEGSLPKPLIELETHHSLHDSVINSIVCNFSEQVVEIKLNGWDREFNNKVKYHLYFKGVSYFDQYIPDSEFGDLGYWEYEKHSEQIEMRMLFASYTELRIRFHDFEFSYERQDG